jgi:hypothetical protein
MKRLLVLFTGLLLVGVIATAQTRPVLSTYSTTLQGIEADTIDLNIMTELDYLSVQFVPTWGATLTDSMDFTYVSYMRNTYTGVWNSILSSKTVSGTTAALVSADVDAVKYYEPMKYLQLRYIVTGVSTDTVLVTINALQK